MVKGNGTRGTGGVGSGAVGGEENGHKEDDDYYNVSKEGGKKRLFLLRALCSFALLPASCTLENYMCLAFKGSLGLGCPPECGWMFME